MPEYEIVAVAPNARDWNSTQGGPMKGYRIDLRDSAGNVTSNCEWSRKASSAAPTVGQKINCEIDQTGQYGPKVKVIPSNSFGGGGGRPRDPQERRSIQMQHAQKCAVDVVRIAVDAGAWKPESVGQTTDAVNTVARKLHAAIEDVAK